MKVIPTAIAGVSIVETAVHSDHRGSFARFFAAEELTAVTAKPILHINHSRTAAKGSIRGLHFQLPPFAEMKMVRCLKGRVMDVAVDLRLGSPTFLHYHTVELSAENAKMLVIPEGCAHGFQTLEEHCELLYLHTTVYNQEAEGGLRYDDPAIGIKWALPISDISTRDTSHPLIDDNFLGIFV
jgi:dTDP-4-dehydrorhamnose 3,5-epimerase